MAVRGFLAVAVLLTSGASGQAQTSTLAFDAASLKVADRTFVPGVTYRMKGGPGTHDPGRITYTHVLLTDLLAKAWGVARYRIAGPAWLSDPMGNWWYTIDAVLPPETTPQQFQQMLQNLLVERFKIRLHHETRVYPGYELVVAAGGAKLKPSADPDAPDPAIGSLGKLDAGGFLILPPGHGYGLSLVKGGWHAKFQNYTIADLSPYLSTFIEQSTGEYGATHIVDNTGLSGKYDFTLLFDARGAAVAVPVGAPPPNAAEAAPVGSASEPSGLPNLFTAIEKQLGLKLVKGKNGFPLDTLVIDHAERVPTEN
ncbi:MAG TPA: TIGR03435 family protein [Bryobacteraceae bacterium]|nr:TIGR03435 family protein [Bryobacteraceae bacterium]